MKNKQKEFKKRKMEVYQSSNEMEMNQPILESRKKRK